MPKEISDDITESPSRRELFPGYQRFFHFGQNSKNHLVSGKGRAASRKSEVHIPSRGIKTTLENGTSITEKDGEVIEANRLNYITRYPDAEHSVLKKISSELGEKLRNLDELLVNNLALIENDPSKLSHFPSIFSYIESTRRNNQELTIAQKIFLAHAVAIIQVVKELSLEQPWVTPGLAAAFRTNGITGFVRVFTGHNHKIRGFSYDKSNEFLFKTSVLPDAGNNLMGFTFSTASAKEDESNIASCPFHSAGRKGVNSLINFFDKNPITNEEAKQVTDEIEMLFFRDYAEVLGALLTYPRSLKKNQF